MKLALHSVSYAGLWRGQKYLPLADFIEKAASLGYDGVEIMAKRPHASLLDMDDGARKRIRERLEKTRLECACIAGYTDFTAGMISGMMPVGEMQIAYVSGLAELARDLGCSLVRVFTGYEREGAGYWAQWDNCVKAVRECAKRAADYGVTIGIQNHHDIGVDPRSMREFIREVSEPNCKAMFDAWAPGFCGDDLREAVRLMSDVLVYTTAADYARLPRYKYAPDYVSYERQQDLLIAVPMGEGFVDYNAFFAALKDCGYDGYVAYEMCSEFRGGGAEENLDMYARRFVEYMRKYAIYAEDKLQSVFYDV